MSSSEPFIYFICPDHSFPVGGIKVLYMHVDILNQHGFQAAIVHGKPGFRVTWFENTTVVTHIRAVPWRKQDIIVLPEYMAGFIHRYRSLPAWKRLLKQRFSGNRLKYYFPDLAALPLKKVIYNQNAYKTFETYPAQPHDWEIPYLQTDVIRTVVVSEDNAAYLRYTFPGHPVERVHVSFDHRLFCYSAAKKKQICYMPRKNLDDVRQLIGIMQAKGWLNDFTVVAIDGYSEEKVAEILKESLIFMSFGYPEGSPLPPCEAMLCGCVVVGYHGWGGREYFKPDFCYPVEVGDIMGFARQMEHVLTLYHTQPEFLLQQGKAASVFVSQYFDASVEKEDVLRIWTAIRQEVNGMQK